MTRQKRSPIRFVSRVERYKKFLKDNPSYSSSDPVLVSVSHQRPKRCSKPNRQRYNKPQSYIIPKQLFQRLVKEIALDMNDTLKFQSSAVLALHAASEEYLVELFSRTMKCAHHAKRVTVMSIDMKLVLACQL